MQRMVRVPLRSCVYPVTSASPNAAAGLGTSVGRRSPRALERGSFRGSRSCSKSLLEQSVCDDLNPLNLPVCSCDFFLDPLEDVLNFFMTIGSPALAAYSLQITHLNAGWITRAFLDLEYPNSREIGAVLSAFQHVPIRILATGGLLPSLLVLQPNDAYWQLLLKGAEKTRRWSIPLVVGFIWVVVATLLTIIDSFHHPPTDDVGYAIVAAWTYLLPLIMGWLHVGSQPEPGHLRECLDSANKIAWAATDSRDRPVPAKEVAGRQAQAIELVRANDVDRARMDELRTVPVFNYARSFIWAFYAQQVLSFAKSAADKAEQLIPVDNYGPGRGATWVVSDNWRVAKANRLGTEDQVIRYCTETFTPFEKVFGAPSPIISPSPSSYGAPSTPIALLPFYGPGREIRRYSRWAPGIWWRTTLAVVFALGLQWGTIGAAVAIHYWKAPVGLGCRAMSFLLYGTVATASMGLCLTSSILAHISRPQQQGPIYWLPWSRTCLDFWAVVCGYLGKALACASGVGIMVVCFFQSSGVFTNCFCASTTFDKGLHDVVFLTINYVVGPGIVRVWIGGLILAFSTAVLFGFSLYLGTPPRR